LKPKCCKTRALGPALRKRQRNISNIRKENNRERRKSERTRQMKLKEVTLTVFAIKTNIQRRGEQIDGLDAGSM